VIDVERQLAASLIDIERAGLKDRLLAARVELLEVDEVLAEILEVAAIADETVDALDQRGGAGLCRITPDQRTLSLLGLTARDLLEPLRRERGALGRGELGAPLDVGCKLRLYGAKLLLRERLAVAPERHDDFVTEPHDSLLPSWVDTGGQIERPPGLDVR